MERSVARARNVLVLEQLERSARALTVMPRWMASSVTATRSVPRSELATFRALASAVARRYDLYVTVEEGDLSSACFFRRDE